MYAPPSRSEGRRVAERAPGESPRTPGGLPITLWIEPLPSTVTASDLTALRLRIEFAHLGLLGGFDELLCLETLQGIERLPHQIETVRRVLRHFRGRALLADEVGLGKTIEVCMLLKEYLLRHLANRVLILVPAPLVSQWHEELSARFGLEFSVADGPSLRADPALWRSHDRVLTSISLARGRRYFEAVTAADWDMVIVDEAHHCKNRSTRNWQLVNALRRRFLFLLTATPVQNDMLELYNLLTLLEPGHLKTEQDFKKTFVTRGNPRDPKNREKLRRLLSEVMVRNTRSQVNVGLPARYAQTFVLHPSPDEALAYGLLETWLRDRLPAPKETEDEEPLQPDPSSAPIAAGQPPLTRMQLNYVLLAAGSHPATLIEQLERLALSDPSAHSPLTAARNISRSVKEEKLLELLKQQRDGKILVFVSFRATLERLKLLLSSHGILHSVFSGSESSAQKDAAVEAFRTQVPVMLCTESGGEGRNLQFANTLINFDLPWNPMRIEQRIGRIHRIGQTREVFVFNLVNADSLEARILRLLEDKIRMFELIVGEVGSILGNLEGGEEFETLVLNLWLSARDRAALDASFDQLGDALLDAQENYLNAKKLDDALFGEDFE